MFLTLKGPFRGPIQIRTALLLTPMTFILEWNTYQLHPSHIQMPHPQKQMAAGRQPVDEVIYTLWHINPNFLQKPYFHIENQPLLLWCTKTLDDLYPPCTENLPKKHWPKWQQPCVLKQCPQPPHLTKHNHFTITEHVWMNHSKMKNSLLTEGVPHFKLNKSSARQYHWIPKPVCKHKSLPKSSKVGQESCWDLKSAYSHISKPSV